MPGLDYSIPGLIAAAGGADPWELARAVTDAYPETLRVVGEDFGARGRDAVEVARLGGLADNAGATAYSVDGAPVFDAAGSGFDGRRLLSDDGAALTGTGAVFTALAEDLIAAQNAAKVRLDTVTVNVNKVIADRNRFFAESGRNLLPQDVDAADRGFHADAAQQVSDGIGPVQEVLDAYDTQVAGHTTSLGALPHAPPAPAPAAAAPAPPAPGPWEVAGAIGSGAVNGLASLGNAIAHNPLEALAFAGGVALAGISAVGVAGGAAATATGVGAAPGIPLTGLSAAGVATGGTIATVAGAGILRDALGADRVSPLGSNPFGDTFPAATLAPTMIDAAGNAWDGNETWEPVPNRPQGEDIAHTPGSRAHIPFGSYLEGGRMSGGHWAEAGVPDKTVFPPDWTPERILERTLDVARNPDLTPKQRENDGAWTLHGTRDGIEITVILEENGNIRTAHPVSGPGVRHTDANGELQPPDEN